MAFRVELYLGDRLLKPEEYKLVEICNVQIDRIVNAIYEASISRDCPRQTVAAYGDMASP